MIVDVIETDLWPKDFNFEIEPSTFDLDTEGFRLKSHARATGKVEKHAGRFVVEGRVEADSQVDCSRCLEPVDRPLLISFSIRLLQTGDIAECVEKEIEKSDLDSSVLEGNQIDLTEIVREQILLDIPEQVLCKEDCLGLCPKCGSNRNLIDCKCEEDEIDPRWAALKNLKNGE